MTLARRSSENRIFAARRTFPSKENLMEKNKNEKFDVYGGETRLFKPFEVIYDDGDGTSGFVVALGKWQEGDGDSKVVVGLRWYEKGRVGFPQSYARPSWLVLPDSIGNVIRGLRAMGKFIV
jgi:hypothetical protein